MITKIKDFWFFLADLPPYKALVVILGMAITFFGWYYYENEKKKGIEMEQMRQDVQECAEISKQLEDLKRDFILLKASQDYLPIPYWIKSTSGKILYVNAAYHDQYLKPKGISITDYVGAFDNMIWEAEEVNRFRANDTYVLQTGKPHVFVELVNNKAIRVLKYPYKMGDFVIGVAGIEYKEY